MQNHQESLQTNRKTSLGPGNITFHHLDFETLTFHLIGKFVCLLKFSKARQAHLG